MGQPPNLRELISSADGVTFWAKHDKAMAELDYSPRKLEQGLRDTLTAEGKPLAEAEARVGVGVLGEREDLGRLDPEHVGNAPASCLKALSPTSKCHTLPYFAS